jgi:hypothetical protein
MSNELWEVKMKSEEMKLTSSMKTFLQVISERGFEFLQNEGIFQDFVEIDNSSETFSSITFNKSFLSEEIECSICLDRFKIPFVGRDDKGVFSGQLLSTCLTSN